MDFAGMLSQLEESKFLRLFRHLEDAEDPANEDRLRVPATPLDLPDAELLVKSVGRVNSLRSWAASWVFQIAHLPSSLWDEASIEAFIKQRLRQAFENLRSKTEPLELLWGANQESQSCDYYLFTNICHDLGDTAASRFSSIADDMFTEILNIPTARHPRFGWATPETIAGSARSVVEKFILDLLQMPSSYYFVAREGKISVVPTTEHGAFFASRSGSSGDPSVDGLSTVVTSTLAPVGRLEMRGLSDLETLINNRTTKEADLQSFFETYPQFLFALDERYCEIRPHVCLLDAKRERLVPDFMARIEDSGIWDVIELKRPQHTLTVRNSKAERPSAAAARAVAELLQYRDFFSTRDNRNRVGDRFQTTPYEPCLVLVIGRGRTRERYEWRSTRAGFPRVQIVSYDYVFRRAQECSDLLSERNLTRRSRVGQ